MSTYLKKARLIGNNSLNKQVKELIESADSNPQIKQELEAASFLGLDVPELIITRLLQ